MTVEVGRNSWWTVRLGLDVVGEGRRSPVAITGHQTYS